MFQVFLFNEPIATTDSYEDANEIVKHYLEIELMEGLPINRYVISQV